MKIVFNTDSLIMGGAEKLALQYVKFLAEHFEVLLLINENILLNEVVKVPLAFTNESIFLSGFKLLL